MWIAIVVLAVGMIGLRLVGIASLQKQINELDVTTARLQTQMNVDRIQFNSLWEKVHGYKLPTATDLATDAPRVPLEAAPEAQDAVLDPNPLHLTPEEVKLFNERYGLDVSKGQIPDWYRAHQAQQAAEVFQHHVEQPVYEYSWDKHLSKGAQPADEYPGQIEVGQVWQALRYTGIWRSHVSVRAVITSQSGKNKTIQYGVDSEIAANDACTEQEFLDRFRWVSNGEAD